MCEPYKSFNPKHISIHICTFEVNLDQLQYIFTEVDLVKVGNMRMKTIFFHRLKSSNKSILLQILSHSLSRSFCILRIKKINKTETYFFLHTDIAK